MPTLRGTLGDAAGEFLYQACRGIDPGIYEGETRQHSISTETTFENDTANHELLERTLFDLCNNVMLRLLEQKATSQVVFLRLRYADFTTVSVQKKMGHPIASIEECHTICMKLLAAKWDGRTPIRLVGMGFDQVSHEISGQNELFEVPDARRTKVEQTVMGIRGKFSASAIRKASLLTPVIPLDETNKDKD